MDISVVIVLAVHQWIVYTYKILRDDQVAVNETYRPRDNIPYVYTMGPKSLMRVKHLVMIVNGKEKAEILNKF